MSLTNSIKYLVKHCTFCIRTDLMVNDFHIFYFIYPSFTGIVNWITKLSAPNWQDIWTVTRAGHCYGRAKVTVSVHECVSQKTRKLYGPEKPFVKLRPAYSVKLVFLYVVNGIKIKMTAKFRDTEHLRFEDTKRIMSPGKFRVFRETGPRPEYSGFRLAFWF